MPVSSVPPAPPSLSRFDARILAPTAKRKAVKCRRCCRKFISFFVSNVGLCVLVVLYSVAGAFMFRHIEGPHEEQKALQVEQLREASIEKLWNITYDNNIDLAHPEWKRLIAMELKKFQSEILLAIKDGYEGQHNVGNEQWSVSGAFLYSLTVISTIGYGNICPRTNNGKLLTIVYAIFGIPLMLLYLTNIGDILAKSFRYVYGGLCTCKQSHSFSDKRTHKNHLRYRDQFMQRSISYAANSSMSGDTSEMMVVNNGEWSSRSTRETNRVHVPITLCLLILTSYVCGGGALFSLWENWNYLDGSYFCFVTLSTIGFGDLVPGASVVGSSSQEQLVICSLYLLAGMALLAMCFKLMQEEVIHKVRMLGKKIGILHEDSDEEDKYMNDFS